jgi:DNA-binding PadR family transcriptional regulator
MSANETIEGKRRRYYRATNEGLEALEKARVHITELVKEIKEE